MNLHRNRIFRQLNEEHPRMAWIYVSTKVDTHQEQAVAFQQIAETCRRRGGSGCGGVSRMGPRHASGGLGRTPNPGLAVCAGQRTRASGDRAYMGEGALLAKHCFASARTHSRQRLGRAPEGDLQRPPQPDPPRHPTDSPLLTLTLMLIRQVQGAALPNPYRPSTRAIASTSSSPVTGLRRKPPMPAASTCCCRSGSVRAVTASSGSV